MVPLLSRRLRFTTMQRGFEQAFSSSTLYQEPRYYCMFVW